MVCQAHLLFCADQDVLYELLGCACMSNVFSGSLGLMLGLGLAIVVRALTHLQYARHVVLM
jgi:hypothetical protein